MYSSDGTVAPRGGSYAVERRYIHDLEALRREAELAEAEITAVSHLTQRTLTEALTINLVKAEVARVDPDDFVNYQYLANIGMARLGRALSGGR